MAAGKRTSMVCRRPISCSWPAFFERALPEVHDEPCVWCGGGLCHTGGLSMCEPFDYLLRGAGKDAAAFVEHAATDNKPGTVWVLLRTTRFAFSASPMCACHRIMPSEASRRPASSKPRRARTWVSVSLVLNHRSQTSLTRLSAVGRAGLCLCPERHMVAARPATRGWQPMPR